MKPQKYTKQRRTNLDHPQARQKLSDIIDSMSKHVSILRLMVWVLPLFSLLDLACSSTPPAPLPRPMGYPRLDLPSDFGYDAFEEPGCSYSFTYPDFAQVSKFRSDSCWVDIYFPPFDCTWHITYREPDKIAMDRAFSLEEHRSLIYKHSKKASNIVNSPLAHPNGYGNFYEVYGNVGTPAQVFFSDSTDTQIVMTSFYYNRSIQSDSLQPVSEFMKQELLKMVESIQWN